MADATRPRRRFRRLLKATAILVALALIAIAAAPWIAGTPPARRYFLGKINAILAPSSIEIDALGLSWTGSTRIEGLVLRDPKGKAVVKVPVAVLDRSVSQLLKDRSDLGTLTLQGPTFDVERRSDGSIDLLDLLPKPGPPGAPPSEPQEPPPALALRVVGGVLKFKSPELPDGFTAERLDVDLSAPRSGPIQVAATLANPSKSETLEVLATISPAGIDAQTIGTRWPWSMDVGGVLARGHLDGKTEIHRRGSSVALKGNIHLRDIDASGPSLAGDRVKLDDVSGAWDADFADGAWTVRSFSWKSPIGAAEGRGNWPPSPSLTTNLTAQVDLAALARQAPHLLRLQDGLAIERGLARLSVRTAKAVGGELPLAIEAKISDVVVRGREKTIPLRDPAVASALMMLGRGGYRVERLEAKTPFLDVSGSGGAAEGIAVTADVDLAGLERELRDVINFGGLKLSGQGRLTANLRNNGNEFAADLKGDLNGLALSGILDQPVATESLHVEGSAKGPIGGDGIPTDWSSLRFTLRSAEGWLNSGVNRADGAIAVGLAVSCPLPPAGAGARTDSHVFLRWKDAIAEINDVHIGIRPSVIKPEFALSGRGRFDSVKGEVVLSAPEKPSASDTVFILGDGLRISGIAGNGSGFDIEGNFAGDLTALDRVLSGWTDSPPIDLAGKFQALVSLGPPLATGRKAGVTIAVTDLVRSASDGSARSAEGSVGLVAKGTIDADAIAFETLNLATRYATITASGRLDHPWTSRVGDFRGTLAPDWKTLDAILAESVEPGAHVDGKPRTFLIRGPLSATGLAALLSGLDAEIGFDLTSAKAMGVKVGPASIVLRCGAGKWSIDPITTLINGGWATLKPALVLDDAEGATFSLLPGSAIQHAAIDADVARTLLAFLAPVMEEATDIAGTISASVDRCSIPLWGGAADRSPRVDGRVAFENVTFGPGPLAGELVGFVAPGRLPTIRLHQAVSVSIADHRVTQDGLSIPISGAGSIGLAGSVGFDRTLALRAEIPLPIDRIAGKLGGVATPPATVPLAIGGTLARPTIDRRELARALEAAGRKAVERNASRIESDVLKRIGGGDRPDVRKLLDGLGRGGGGMPR